MPASEELRSNTGDSCETASSVTIDLEAEKGTPDETPGVHKPKTFSENSSAAAKTSKRFIDEDSKSPEYRSDAWRMANFKVVPCSKRYAHDWTICPFAHPGEKARRRDPKIYSYAGIACPEMKKAGFCNRGDRCPYAHNVFEFWLHPTRYRTQLCNDGPSCTRNVCFFAHTVEEMRPVPCKPVDKKDLFKGGAVSPDTPFLQTGTSIMTSSSTGSGEIWHMLMPEDRAASTSFLPDDVSLALPKQQMSPPTNELIDELASSLANVKLAMAGEKREEVMKLLSTLLQEAAEDRNVQPQHTPLQPPPSAAPHNYAAELSMALSALDRSQARSLLADVNRRNLMVSQLANTSPDAGQDWQHLAQQMLEVPMEGPTRVNASRPVSAENPLLSAPAALEPGRSADAGVHLASRVLSADLGLSHHPNFWQSAGVHELAHIPPDIPRAPASRFHRGMSGDIDASPKQLPSIGMVDDNLFNGSSFPLSANPGALRKQSLNLDELSAHKQQPTRREVRRPPISAFQTAASQDWKQPVGRVPNSGEARWASGRMSSSDLVTIDEGLPPLSYQSTEMYHQTALQREPSATLPFANLDRSKSTGVGIEPVLNLLPTPLSFPVTQPGGRDTSALHTAPYNLNLACEGDRSCLARPHRQSLDQLQGWGGLQAQDFGLQRY